MVHYICERCKDPFGKKNELEKHQNKKTKCEIREKSDKVLERFVCERCKDPFYKKCELESHENRKNPCKIREKSDKILESCTCICGKELSNPSKLKDHEKKCVKFVKKSISFDNNTMGNNNVNTLTNTNINNNNNIVINIINKISLCSYLDMYGIKRLMGSEQNEVMDINNNPQLTLFRIIHCSRHRDSCHNIYYDQKRHPNVWIHNGYYWKSDKMSDVINRVLKVQQAIFKTFLKNDTGNLRFRIKKHINDYLESIDSTNENFDKNILALLHKDIKNLLIENAPMIYLIYSDTKTDNSLPRRDYSSLSSDSPTKNSWSENESYTFNSDSDSSSEEEPIKIIKKKRKTKK